MKLPATVKLSLVLRVTVHVCIWPYAPCQIGFEGHDATKHVACVKYLLPVRSACTASRQCLMVTHADRNRSGQNLHGAKASRSSLQIYHFWPCAHETPHLWDHPYYSPTARTPRVLKSGDVYGMNQRIQRIALFTSIGMSSTGLQFTGLMNIKRSPKICCT